MPGLQNIQNGVTTGGFGAFGLDISPAINQFVQGQEIEQARRRKVILNNERMMQETDLSKLSQSDLDGGIKDKYSAYQKLGMDSSYKDFNKHDAELRAAHSSIQNDISTAMAVRKANMALYDDVKALLPPEELIRLQEDIKQPSIRKDGTQNLLNSADYKLKPKDFLDVNKGILDIIKENTNKQQTLTSKVRKDGKYNELNATRINVKNTIATSLERYTNDPKWKESVDNAVSQANSSNPGGAKITAEDYIESVIDRQISSKQSDKSKQLYPQGVYGKGKDEAYIDVDYNTPNNYVSHVTVKVGDKEADKKLGLYNNAHDYLNRWINGKGSGTEAAAFATKIMKGSALDGGNVSGIEPYTDSHGQKGLKVFYTDAFMGKMEPKVYVGTKAMRQLGLSHNMLQKSLASQVVPDASTKAQTMQEKNAARAASKREGVKNEKTVARSQIKKAEPITGPKTKAPKAQKVNFKGLPPTGKF